MYVGKLEKWGGKREKFIFALESNKEKRVFKKFPATAAGGLYAIIIIIMHSKYMYTSTYNTPYALHASAVIIYFIVDIFSKLLSNSQYNKILQSNTSFSKFNQTCLLTTLWVSSGQLTITFPFDNLISFSVYYIPFSPLIPPPHIYQESDPTHLV